MGIILKGADIMKICSFDFNHVLISDHLKLEMKGCINGGRSLAVWWLIARRGEAAEEILPDLYSV